MFLAVTDYFGMQLQVQRKNRRSMTEAFHPRDSGYLFDGRITQWMGDHGFWTQGDVYVSDDKIVLGMGDGCTGITWKEEFPVANYEVTLEAMRVDGN